jgi:hypothetical protein
VHDVCLRVVRRETTIYEKVGRQKSSKDKGMKFKVHMSSSWFSAKINGRLAGKLRASLVRRLVRAAWKIDA